MMQALMEAMSSHNLAEGIGDNLVDVDWIRAAGMAGQTHSTAIAVWQFAQLGERRALRAAFDGVVAEAVKLGITSDPTFATSRVLEYLASPSCPHCKGRGFELMAGQPVLSDKACSHCDGTGIRSREHWRDAEKALFDRLLELQQAAAGAIIRKMH